MTGGGEFLRDVEIVFLETRSSAPRLESTLTVFGVVWKSLVLFPYPISENKKSKIKKLKSNLKIIFQNSKMKNLISFSFRFHLEITKTKSFSPKTSFSAR